jgi:hypothetical protein
MLSAEIEIVFVIVAGILLVVIGNIVFSFPPATAGPFTQERPIKVIFANPPSTVAPGAVPHRKLS